MQNYAAFPTRFLGLFLVALSWLSACQKQESEPITPASDVQVITYKNQTGDPQAEALQVQVVDTKKKFTVNVYGTFSADKAPLKARSLTFQKTGNDTTVHLQLNEFTNQLETSYLEVRGTKQPWVIKHGYVAGDPNAMRLSVYAYNWQTATGVLKNETLYRRAGATTTATPVFAANRGTAGGVSGSDILVGVGVGLGTAEVVFVGLYGAGAGLLSIGVAAAVISVSAVAVAVVAVVVAIAIVTSSTSHASEFDPRDTPYPPNTPPRHASTLPSPASLPPSPCAGANIRFQASMDGSGHILVAGASGGAAPYSYAVDNQNFQASEVFSGTYPDGGHLILVRSATGCISGQVVTLTRAPANTVTDIDGNVYNTVLIGTQRWMKENLRTTRFRDGTAITEVLMVSVWFSTAVSTRLPAYCYPTGMNYPINWVKPSNWMARVLEHGYFYNQYAATSTRELCPLGWHVPVDAEWQVLINSLGGQAVAGGVLKSTPWGVGAVAASNSSNFTALNTGFIDESEQVIAPEGNVKFITKTTAPYTSGSGAGIYNYWVLYDLTGYDNAIYREPTASPEDGGSCRCLKD